MAKKEKVLSFREIQALEKELRDKQLALLAEYDEKIRPNAVSKVIRRCYTCSKVTEEEIFGWKTEQVAWCTDCMRPMRNRVKQISGDPEPVEVEEEVAEESTEEVTE